MNRFFDEISHFYFDDSSVVLTLENSFMNNHSGLMNFVVVSPFCEFFRFFPFSSKDSISESELSDKYSVLYFPSRINFNLLPRDTNLYVDITNKKDRKTSVCIKTNEKCIGVSKMLTYGSSTMVPHIVIWAISIYFDLICIPSLSATPNSSSSSFSSSESCFEFIRRANSSNFLLNPPYDALPHLINKGK